MPILYVDTETTHLDAQAGSVIDLAAQLCKATYPFAKLGQHHTGICSVLPHCDIQDSALKVNGITRQQIDGGKNPQTAIMQFIEWLDELQGNNLDPVTLNLVINPVMLAGHNVQFDIRFIKAWFERHGLGSLMNRFHYRAVDVQAIAWARLVATGALTKTSLGDCTRYFEIPHVAHTADGDVEAGMEVLRRLVAPMKELVEAEIDT